MSGHAKAEPRVLSIQSHVVHGYVGNKAAVLPLQVLGLEVDSINSVQFSNHTGYPKFTGDRLGGDSLWELIEGLQFNGLLGGYSHILTGYIGSASFLRTVLRAVRAIRDVRPEAIYICDPVLGDRGKLYVPAELVEIYIDEVLPLANTLTPNHFEAELLTRTTIKTAADAFRACALLHARGVRTVVITSADLEDSDEAAGETITLLASQQPEGSGGAYARYRVEIPALPGTYTGTGDLTAALLLAWMHKLGADSDLAPVLEKTVASVQAVLRRTHDEAGAGQELRLVQSIADLIEPKVVLRATKWTEP